VKEKITQNKIIVTEKKQSHLFSYEGIELGVSKERSQQKKKKNQSLELALIRAG
jgi:hypothetical protein